MQARGILLQEIKVELEDHIEIVEKREGLPSAFLAVTLSQFRARQITDVGASSPCNKDHTVL